MIASEDPEPIKFDTFHFDDFVQIDVFHKGSIQNNSKIGKAFLNLRDLHCKQYDDEINRSKTNQIFMTVPVRFKPSNYGIKRNIVNGQIFVKVKYEPRQDIRFYADWRHLLYNVHPATQSTIDRFEHLNDFLSNDFTDYTQFGVLTIDLTSVRIPENIVTGDDNTQGINNKVFMLKLKQGHEQKIIFVGSPNQIYGSHLEANRLHSMVENIKDVVYIELYDVLNEDNFDPKIKQPMENLRLLATKTFEVKDLPFEKDCFVESYSVLMPI
jgi:hypothetical protein